MELRERMDDALVMRRFRLRDDPISLTEECWIEDETGNPMFEIGPTTMRADRWVLRDTSRTKVASIHERLIRRRPAIEIDVGGRRARVRKPLIPSRDRFHVEIDSGEDLMVKGYVAARDYEIERSGRPIAVISTQWLQSCHAYGIEVHDPAEVVLVLAIVVAVASLART